MSTPVRLQLVSLSPIDPTTALLDDSCNELTELFSRYRLNSTFAFCVLDLHCSSSIGLADSSSTDQFIFLRIIPEHLQQPSRFPLFMDDANLFWLHSGLI